MALSDPAFVLENRADHKSELLRQLVEALVPTPGVVDKAAGHLAVTELATPAMAVQVAAGDVFIDGTEAAAQGFYFAKNDGVVQRTIAASDATNPRKDLVVVHQPDSAYSGTSDIGDIVVVTGVPAASPAEPAVPDNAEVLCLVDVPAGATAITNAEITDRRTQAAITPTLLGPVVQVGGAALSADTAATLDTVKQWGTQEVDFPDADDHGAAVKVIATLTGSVSYNSVTTSRRRVRTYIEISLDGGATWARSQETLVEVHGNDQRAAAVPVTFYLTGTPTGTVQVRAMLEQVALGTAGDVSFTAGYITATVVPA